MSASDCPSPWVHNPADVRIDGYKNIAVKNIWKNTNTGEVLVHFMTITTVTRNVYVEAHSDPETVESRLQKVKDLVTRKDVEVEFDSVTVTGGSGVAKCRSDQKALQKANEYMNGDLDDFYFQS